MRGTASLTHREHVTPSPAKRAAGTAVPTAPGPDAGSPTLLFYSGLKRGPRAPVQPTRSASPPTSTPRTPRRPLGLPLHLAWGPLPSAHSLLGVPPPPAVLSRLCHATHSQTLAWSLSSRPAFANVYQPTPPWTHGTARSTRPRSPASPAGSPHPGPDIPPSPS